MNSYFFYHIDLYQKKNKLLIKFLCQPLSIMLIMDTIVLLSVRFLKWLKFKPTANIFFFYILGLSSMINTQRSLNNLKNIKTLMNLECKLSNIMVLDSELIFPGTMCSIDSFVSLKMSLICIALGIFCIITIFFYLENLLCWEKRERIQL